MLCKNHRHYRRFRVNYPMRAFSGFNLFCSDICLLLRFTKVD
jgi:hypothetical protein